MTGSLQDGAGQWIYDMKRVRDATKFAGNSELFQYYKKSLIAEEGQGGRCVKQSWKWDVTHMPNQDNDQKAQKHGTLSEHGLRQLWTSGLESSSRAGMLKSH